MEVDKSADFGYNVNKRNEKLWKFKCGNEVLDHHSLILWVFGYFLNT